MALDGFSAVQLVPPAPEVLAKAKTTVFYNGLLRILQLELSHYAI